jgi:hypothetical protein
MTALVCAICGAPGDVPRIVLDQQREPARGVTLRPTWHGGQYRLVCECCRSRLNARPASKVRREP